MHPILDEICRLRDGEPLRSDVLRRWQQQARLDIQPKLDRLDQLEREQPAKTAAEQEAVRA